MFKSARIKLTTSYLLIIMIITLAFSAAIYTGVGGTTKRALRVHELRFEGQLRDFRGNQNFPERFQAPPIEDVTKQIKNNTIYLLAAINLVIFIVSGSFGYWFAGATLKPIEEMVRKQKKFVADAAHEFKTPLTAIKTQLEVNMRNKDLDLAQAKKIMESTVEDVDSLASLTNSLLKQSKYQEDKTNRAFELFNLKVLIDNIIQKFKNKMEVKNIVIKTDALDIQIKADKNSIAELITIILDNAVKFNKENGEISIDARKEGENVTIKVADTGIGIDKNDLPYIFDRFYKADSSRAKVEHDGFGLGLSIAKEIVELHKGTIAAKSKKGESTVFTVTLPTNI